MSNRVVWDCRSLDVDPSPAAEARKGAGRLDRPLPEAVTPGATAGHSCLYAPSFYFVSRYLQTRMTGGIVFSNPKTDYRTNQLPQGTSLHDHSSKDAQPKSDQDSAEPKNRERRSLRCLFLFKTHPPAPAEARTGAGVAGS